MSNSTDKNDQLNERMGRFQDNAIQTQRRRPGMMAIGIVATALIGAGAYGGAWLLQNATQGRLGTSDAEEFQNRRGGGLALEFPADEQRRAPAEASRVEAAPVETPPVQIVSDDAVLKELERLRGEMAGMASKQGGEDVEAVVKVLKESMQTQIDDLTDRLADADTQRQRLVTSYDSQLHGLQSMLDAEKARRQALETQIVNGQYEADEAKRQAEAERQAQELINRQIVSPAVVYATGQSVQGTSEPGSGRRLSANESFLQENRPLVVQEAEAMEDPHRTLAQGSVIQAALQVAVNSDLPGNVVAVVSEPVPAFSGDAILVPRGSRLFGSYSSGIEAGQKRILIAWNRVLTPDGTSMAIASVGGDRLGRSGITGFVDTKFGERFGGAALISIIGAAPSVAAANVDDDIGSETLEQVGDDLSSATDSVIADQINRQPTIYIDQGASVTVIVDRDVVIY